MDKKNEHTIIPDSDTEKLIEVLGLTNSIHEAGYILPDGQLLHMNRSNCFKRKNHLDVLKLLPAFLGKEHSIIDTDMISFMAKEQLVRFCIDGRVHTAVKPTSQQLRKIYTTLAYRSTPFEIIISNAAGMTIVQHSVSGPSMATLVKIFSYYDSQNEGQFCEDEFSIEEQEKFIKLIFLPAMKTVGQFNKNSKIIKIEPQFKEATKLFLKLIKELRNSN